jgi:hypothetical protein
MLPPVSVRLLEGGLAIAVGAGDAFVASKTTGTGPGKIPWSLYYEGGGVAVGLFGGMAKVPVEMRDAILLSSLTLIGVRAAKYGMAGKLFQPQGWAAIGGEGGAGFGGDGGMGGDGVGGAAGRPGVRVLPTAARGGGFSILPITQEAPGIAG